MKLKILPYNCYSKSARELVKVLSPNAILKKQNTTLKGRKILLNWGNSSPNFNIQNTVVLNTPQAIKIASNKLSALLKLKESNVSVPEFTTDIEIAKQWIRENKIVLCRTLLKSNSGKGIIVAKELNDLVYAPLYVKYVRKEIEYRIHVFNNKVIDYVEKKKRTGFTNNPMYNKYIRSHNNGWVFCRENIMLDDDVKHEALLAVQSLGLDFGAVDIVIRKTDNKPIILEVNTAPGLEGTTLTNYKLAIKEWMYENF